MNLRKGFLEFTLALSIFVGGITAVCHERFFDKNEIDVTFPEHWKRISTQEKLDSLGGLLSKDAPFSLLSKIKQFKIGRQLKKMIVDKEDEVSRDGFHYSFGFRYSPGREEFSLLGLAGFASVWILYAVARVSHSLDSIRADDTFSLASFERTNSSYMTGGIEFLKLKGVYWSILIQGKDFHIFI